MELKVLHINSSDFGGAGIAAMRLHKAMLEQGINSCFMSLDNVINDQKNYFRFNKKKENNLQKPETPCLTLKNYFVERLTKSYTEKLEAYYFNLKSNKLKYEILYDSKDFEIFSTPYSEYDITESEVYKMADIIHLHWAAGYLDYPSFFEKNKKPIVWTIHDENPFRGGFHYKEDEKRNEIILGVRNKEFERIKLESVAKQREISIVSPSKWLAQEAKSSKIFSNRKVSSIYNTIDTSIFKPMDNFFSRQFWSIPQDATVFMFASQSIENKRKGFDLLLPIIQKNDFKDVYFIIVGNTQTLIQNKNVFFTQTITNDRLMALTYSAADYFILPSREDNLPNTMLESIACGTPVICFPISDNKEIIEDSGCGIVTSELSTEALKAAMLMGIKNKYKIDKNRLVEFAGKNFSQNKQVNLYMDEYQILIAKK